MATSAQNNKAAKTLLCGRIELGNSARKVAATDVVRGSWVVDQQTLSNQSVCRSGVVRSDKVGG